MEPQMCTVLSKIMHSYMDVMHEMCTVYDKRIQLLMTQKQICQNQINTMFYQHFQDAINSINKSKEEHKSHYPNQQQIQNDEQYNLNNTINTKHNKNGINLLLEAHQQLLNNHNAENINNEKEEKKQPTNPIRVELTIDKDNEIINDSVYGVEFITTNEENNKKNEKTKNDTQFICSFCKKSCKSKAGLKSHIRKVHKNKRHKKQSVRKSFKPIKMLQKYKNNTDSDSEFNLSDSESIETLRDTSRSRSRGRSKGRTRGRTKKSKKILDDNDNNTDYVSDDTMKKVKEKIQTMDPKKLICPICKKKITNTRHLIVHSKKRPFICDWCNQGYKRDCSLKLHQKKHCKFRHKKNRK
eukprot:423882_1